MSHRTLSTKTARRRRRRCASVGIVTMLVLSLIAACSNSDSSSDSADDAINVAIYGMHASYWPLYIAEEEGYFEEEGVTVELIVPQAGSGITQSVLSGSVQLGIGTPDGFINALNQGQEVRALASLQNSPIGSLLVPKGLSYPDGIRGEIVAVSNEKSGDAYLTAQILETEGIQSQDYQMLSAGGTPDRAASLVSGGVKAALLGQPQDFALMRQGFKRVGFADDVLPEFAWQWISGNAEWIESNDDDVEAFLRAISRATEWWYDKANRDRAVDILSETGNVDARDAEETYDLWQKRSLFERDLIPSQGSYDGIMEFMRSVDLVQEGSEPTYDEFVELSLLEGMEG